MSRLAPEKYTVPEDSAGAKIQRDSDQKHPADRRDFEVVSDATGLESSSINSRKEGSLNKA